MIEEGMKALLKVDFYEVGYNELRCTSSSHRVN